MPKFLEKTINSGSKHTGKLTGGMRFELNPLTAITTTGVVSPNFIPIGTNAGATQLNYSLIPTSSDSYFDIYTSGTPILPQSTAQFQQLRYKKGKFISRLTFRWGINFIDNSADPTDGGWSIISRIRRNRNNSITTITNGLTSSTAENKPNSMSGTTISDLASNDLYWLEIAAISEPTNIVITSAQLVVEE